MEDPSAISCHWYPILNVADPNFESLQMNWWTLLCTWTSLVYIFVMYSLSLHFWLDGLKFEKKRGGTLF